MLSGKGKNPKEKIQEACKEINYRNLVVLITVGDYVINQTRNIKEVTKKWGLSFSTHTEGNVQKMRTQCWWKAICQKEESRRETGGSH